MTNREFLRRALIAAWVLALAYFVLCWFAGVGWVGPGWVIVAWSIVAAPLYLVTLVFAFGRTAIQQRRPRLVLLCWVAAIAINYLPAIDLGAFGWPAFWTLVAIDTGMALWVCWSASAALTAARSMDRRPGTPWAAVLGVAGVVLASIAVFYYRANRPVYVFTVVATDTASPDHFENVHRSVLTVRSDLPGWEMLPELRSYSAASIGGRRAFRIEFKQGVSSSRRLAIYEALRRHPAVDRVDTARASQ